MIEPSSARRLWEALEPIHSSVYFAPEPQEALAAVGLRGFWMGYVASPRRPHGPGVGSRRAGHVRQLPPDDDRPGHPRRLGPGRPRVRAGRPARRGHPGPRRPARRATQRCGRRTAGRAPARLPGPRRPVGPAAVQRPPGPAPPGRSAGPRVARRHGLPGAPRRRARGRPHRRGGERGGRPRPGRRSRRHRQGDPTGARRWSDDEWDVAAAGLRSRRLVDPSGQLTDHGRDLVLRIETITDRRSAEALEPYADVLPDALAAAEALARTVLAAGAMPFPNPMGYARPAWAA